MLAHDRVERAALSTIERGHRDQVGAGPVKPVVPRHPHLRAVEMRDWRQAAVGQHDRLRHCQHRAAQQRCRDRLSRAAAAMLDARQQGREHGREPAVEIDDAEAQPQGGIALAAIFDLPAARRLEQLVEAWPVGALAERTIGTDVAINDVRALRLQRVVVDAQLARRRAADIVVHDISPARERRSRRLGLGTAEHHREAALAALDTRELALKPAHGVARRRLHLDHLRTEIGQQHGRERTRQIRAEVEDLQSVERRKGLGCRRRRDRRSRRPMLQDRVGVSLGPIAGMPDARRRRDRDGDARLERRAEYRVFDGGNEAVGHRLGVCVDLAERRDDLRGDVVRPEMRDPVCGASPGDDRLVGSVIGRDVRWREARVLPADRVGPHRSQRVCHPRCLVGGIMHMDPPAVGRLVERDRDILGQPLGERGRRGLGTRPVHRHRHERRLRQAGVRRTAMPVAGPRDQPRQDRDRRKPAGGPTGERHPDEDRTRTMTRLFVQNAERGQYERFARRRLGFLMRCGPARDRRHDEAWKPREQPGVVQAAAPGGCGRQVVYQHVRLGKETVEFAINAARRKVQNDPPLETIENRREDVGRVVFERTARHRHLHDVGARLRQLERSHRSGYAARQVQHAKAG